METVLENISRPTGAPPPAIEATYKSREVEGIFDLLFYRKVGFRLAQFCARLNITPATVTVIGGVFGIIAGHLYFYRILAINLAGMALHVVANIFDNADGQLARLTNRQSLAGRMLDPFVDHLIFLSIYVHLALRLYLEGFSGAVWLLGLAAGLSHGLQAVAADRSRNAYLYLVKGRGEFDSVATVRQRFQQHSWRANPFTKFLLGMHLNMAREQEFLLPALKRLHEKVAIDLGNQLPDWFQSRYRELVVPSFKWWGLLMTNTRMLVLFVLFIIGQPIWYFWLELIAGNLLLLILTLRLEKTARTMIQLLAAEKDAA